MIQQVQVFDRDVVVFGGEAIQLIGGVRVATTGNDVPAQVGVLLDELKAKPAVGSGDQNSRSRVIGSGRQPCETR